MTVIYSVATNDTVVPLDVNQFKNLLEGGSSTTTTFVMVSTLGTNFVIRLGDAAGANKLSIQNSSSVEKASIDSSGNIAGNLSLTSNTLILPQAATPTQTAEGSVSWDTDDDVLTIGNSAATKLLIPDAQTTIGDIQYASAAKTKARLAIGTAGQALIVNAGATAPQWSSVNPFDSIQTQFRVPRRLLGEFSAVWWSTLNDGSTQFSGNVGVGFTHGNTVATAGTTIGTLTALLLEAYTAAATGASATDVLGSCKWDGSLFTATAPNKNPRMLVRWFPGTSAANLTSSLAGFHAGALSATQSGAYLRANTTGNLFFVTRQGGSETATDLGARPTALTSYEIETIDSGVTWTCRNDTTGAVVATHTTNVPTATVALGYAIGAVAAANLNGYNVAYCRVESNSVA